VSLERDRRVNDLLLQILDLPPEDRGPALDRVCSGDPDLREELDGLLAQEAMLDGFLDIPAVGLIHNDPEEDPAGGPPPEYVGPYRIVDTLGEGGMGTVYLAEQSEPIQRQVALKVIRAGLDSPVVQASFAAESQTLARMSHPNIAQVFDAGTTDGGVPYVTMEHVDGEPITTYCDERRIGIHGRLELFLAVCDGVRHAHTKGIIHRDLKPSNILVCEDEVAAIPKIIDFGIAEILDDPRIGDRPEDRGSRIAGTIGYLSPEVMRGEDADTRTDVFALGMVFHRLLVGVLPQDDHRYGDDSIVKPHQTPSDRLAGLGEQAGAIAAARGVQTSVLIRQVRGDLDWIILKALEADSEKRYQSVAELAADLRLYSSGRPVVAGPDTLGYRLGKAIRRHWVGLSSVALVVLAMIAGLTTTTIAARRARLEAARANLEAEAAREVSDFLVDLFGSADPARAQGRTITVMDLLQDGLERTEVRLGDQPLIRARLRGALGYVHLNLGQVAIAEPLIEETLRMREELLPAGHPDVSESRLHLAQVYQTRGRYDDARSLLLRALTTQEATLGKAHLDVAKTLKRLAVIEWYRGQADEAEVLLVRALEILTPAHSQGRRTAQVLNNLGIVLQEQGRVDETEGRYRQALAILEESLGPEHPDIASCLNNLARALKIQARFDEAEPLYRRALTIRERVLGPDHPELAISLNNLANLQMNRNEFEQAESLLMRSLDISEKALGDDNLEVATALNNLASLFIRREIPEQAEPLLRRALVILEDGLGPDHQRIATSVLNLGQVTSQLGRMDEAERLFKRSLSGFEVALGPDHPDVVFPLVVLGAVYRKTNRYREAETIFGRALTLGLKTLGPGHPLVDEVVTEYTILLQAVGRDSEIGALRARVAMPAE